jgi:aminopeptidase N
MVDYDILAHEIDATYSPERLFMEGTARVKVKIRSPAASTIALRLAESLVVRSVYTESHGRVLHLRVIGQNTLLVNFPGYILGGTELWLTIQYAGRVQPQELDREAIVVTQEAQETITIQPEPRLLYSHRAYWYPQSSVSDYATAKVTMTLPSEYDVVVTGVPVKSTNHRGRRVSVFQTERPVRYLAFVVSRLRDVDQREVEAVRIAFEANPRQVGYARSVISRTEDIFRFYTSLLTRAPYPSFTVAVTERATPGGHSPPYFAVVDQPVQLGSTPWRNDPVSFENYPDFFLAHEIAHQWWGQAVGWKNYHEQWLSEGFAQYFAVLYAERKLNRRTYLSVLRQMNRTAVAASGQGPIYLGYRLGHIKRETTIFRSIIYNKSAMVLHMLRRRMGDEAFFAGLRAYYQDWEFKKAGTGDFQRAMERASGLDLTAFFETWIFGQSIPTVSFTHRIENGELLLRFEQKGEPVDIPIGVTLTDGARAVTDVVVQVSGRVTEHRIPWKGRLRSAVANGDYGALVHVVR